ncbi:MAG: hydrogen peroxide-inducible genes activator [Pseudomonadota bacterium]
MTIKQISCFIAVYEQGSFRRAADRLGVTQPAMTAQISALERTLGVTLFERSRAGARPSAAARELIASAKRIAEELQGFVDASASLVGHSGGTYRMGVTPTLGPYLLPHVLPGLHRRYDSLRLYVREGAPSSLEADLKTGGHDLVLSTQPIASTELEVAPLIREPLKLVMASDHRLARKRRVNRSDLFGEEVLTIEEHHLYHRQISELCASLGATMRRDYEGTSLDTLRQMVVMGMGIAFLPALYVASEIRDTDTLKVTDVHGISMLRHHALAWRARSPARALFAELAEEIRSLVRERLRDYVRLA